MKKFTAIILAAILSGCAYQVPSDWQNASNYEKCEFMGYANARGEAVLAQRIANDLTPAVQSGELDPNMCKAYAREAAQSLVNTQNGFKQIQAAGQALQAAGY